MLLASCRARVGRPVDQVAASSYGFAHHARGRAGDQAVRRDRAADDRAEPDDAILPDPCAFQRGGVGAEPDVIGEMDVGGRIDAPPLMRSSFHPVE